MLETAIMTSAAWMLPLGPFYSIPETVEAPATTSEAIPAEEPASAVIFKSSPTIQELPDYSKVWLDGRVSFVGGDLTSSSRQMAYAEAHGIPLMHSNQDYWQNVQSGHFVKLRHPDLEVGASRPHVLPITAEFIYGIAKEYRRAGCERLRVNSAGRLTAERPSNGSIYSVHPAGMALDLRVINLSQRCYGVLERLLHKAETGRIADVTLEHHPPHFHVVVVPRELTKERVYYVAKYGEDTTRSEQD